MLTQAHFEDIQYHIKKELEKAQTSILIAVTWLTDNQLFDMICNKAAENVSVELIIMNDSINNSSNINHEVLTTNGGKIWKIESKNSKDILIHNKFCIIDSTTIINGSYNWTKKAQENHESITIISENPELVRQFILEFNTIKEKHFGVNAEGIIIDYGKICIRLEILKNAILLGDTDDIGYQLSKLQKYFKPNVEEDVISQIHTITQLIENQNYSDVVTLINIFTNRFKSLTVYIDTDIAALKLEIKALELQLGSLEDEKTEIEKLIHEFEVRHSNELGEIIISILKLRKERLAEEVKEDTGKQPEFEEATKDYEEYQKSYEISKTEKIYNLSEEEKQELKKVYRKASKLCHPDMVAEMYKVEAEAVFNELKEAYDRNDIQKVNEILVNLEKGIFSSNSDEIDEKKTLKANVIKLRVKRDKLEKDLIELKNNETFKVVESIKNWDDYFENTKAELLISLKNLEKQINDGR